MFSLKIAYDNSSENLVRELETLIPSKYPLIKLEAYNENIFKERKKAFKLKNSYSARQCPFAVLLDADKKVVSAFYSEAQDCNLDNIFEVLNNYVTYGKKVY
jgi:hypothetical protein|nr:MAG TPA: putative thiol peroxidase [Bacteriophage sp.]